MRHLVGDRESDGRQNVRWQNPDKYFTFLLHNGIFQNTFIQKKQINQNQYWQFEVTPCVYESRLARYNSFWVMPALLGGRPSTFPRLETKLDPSCEYETLNMQMMRRTVRENNKDSCKRPINLYLYLYLLQSPVRPCSNLRHGVSPPLENNPGQSGVA